jgi:hypothetical protein
MFDPIKKPDAKAAPDAKSPLPGLKLVKHEQDKHRNLKGSKTKRNK